MRKFCAVSAAIGLLAAPAMAGSVTPLPPGTPAGVAKAQDQDDGNTLLYVIGGGAIIAGIALLASDNGNGNSSVGTTTGTTTTTTSTST